ncbi:MAG: hypothetical protein NW226_09900 [Microscillaceae bacterium]|nr:hypothetical protein [Microscillaceae bacterium]
MTVIEKKQQIIQKIQEMPDNLLDDMLKILEDLSSKKEKNTDSDFEKYLQETTEKYRKVWEALA